MQKEKIAMKNKKTLRLLLGDQLNSKHSWFATTDASVQYVLMEIKSETNYALHHLQKIIGFFGAMQSFAKKLQALGHQVIYIHLNDPNNLHCFDKNISTIISNYQITTFEYLQPDEYRVDEHLKQFCAKLSIESYVFDTEHFYSSRSELSELFAGKKTYLMETFYRYMRKKHKVLLIDDDKPMHGKWNFDADNRSKLPKNHQPIAPIVFNNDLHHIEEEIKKANITTIGKVDSKHFIWPIDREQAISVLEYFVAHCLPLFGTFQDAMAPEEWSIYHSRLSFSLNLKIISPAEVINKAIAAHYSRPTEIAFHQLEGFVRQIIGWREYMRGIYWLKMPDYATLNFFDNTNTLPEWFWTGNTKMSCLKNTIQQSLQYAYAHHIQRLMITGNFALLAGVHPDAVDAWYLGIYIDAIEWVEITNTRGMSQFADGGIVGTKPYISSAAYIHKMSSYCSNCYYMQSKKTGDKACPFNSLYWNFYHLHQDKLSKNPRIGMMYQIWHKMNPTAKAELLAQADYYLSNINEL